MIARPLISIYPEFIHASFLCRATLSPCPENLEKFENEVFTLKTHQTFAVHNTPEKFKNATVTGYFGFVFGGNSERKSLDCSEAIVLKVFFVHSKTNTQRFKIHPL